MESKLYIPILYRKGFNIAILPIDLNQKAEQVLLSDKSEYNAKTELLDLTVWNAIKTLFPKDKFVISVSKMNIDTTKTSENNGFNTVVDQEDSEPAVRVEPSKGFTVKRNK